MKGTGALMIRTAIGFSFLVALAVVGMSACSGDSKDEATGKSGSSTGGSGGASGGSGGASSQSGSNSTSGTNAALCGSKMNMCVDDQTVTGCDPDTGMDFTVACDEDVPEGLVNLGCQPDDTGRDVCLLDVADAECWEGAQIFTVCAVANPTEDDLFGFYLGCFTDMNGAKTVIPCYIPFADEATLTIDCLAADEACLPPLGGGGAPSDGGAGPGAGGEPGAGGGG